MHWVQVLNQVLDMALRFNDWKNMSLFANFTPFKLISENNCLSNQYRYNDQSNHLWQNQSSTLKETSYITKTMIATNCI